MWMSKPIIGNIFVTTALIVWHVGKKKHRKTLTSENWIYIFCVCFYFSGIDDVRWSEYIKSYLCRPWKQDSSQLRVNIFCLLQCEIFERQFPVEIEIERCTMQHWNCNIFFCCFPLFTLPLCSIFQSVSCLIKESMNYNESWTTRNA